ncbi:TIR domain-containing protein [Clostridium sp. YIM B02555]|uniref:TIR domain-containing protein n=1 Tax=Clostridium sp. YIM B02555 TaxID=2911968 RepID=UPI001EEEC4DE|nr:TIR domain-containing protein [Clostridium sp. YIM B02555]
MNTKNLFFSYYFKNSNEYGDIIQKLKDRGYFDFKNGSLNEENPAQTTSQIKNDINAKIDWAGTVVVIIGPGTYTRSWVNYEIDYAAEKNKRIVGVYLYGQSSSKIPSSLRTLKDNEYKELALVRWNTDSIVNAIRGTNSWDEGDK